MVGPYLLRNIPLGRHGEAWGGLRMPGEAGIRLPKFRAAFRNLLRSLPENQFPERVAAQGRVTQLRGPIS